MRSANSYFTLDVIRRTSKILNIPEEVVIAVIDSVILHILKDCSKQSDDSRSIVIRIPILCDIYAELSEGKRKSVKLNEIYLDNKFKSRLIDAVYTDKDILNDNLTSDIENLIVDNFLKVFQVIKDE